MTKSYLVSAKGEVIVSAIVFADAETSAKDLFLKKLGFMDYIFLEDDEKDVFEGGKIETSFCLPSENTYVGLECDDDE